MVHSPCLQTADWAKCLNPIETTDLARPANWQAVTKDLWCTTRSILSLSLSIHWSRTWLMPSLEDKIKQLSYLGWFPATFFRMSNKPTSCNVLSNSPGCCSSCLQGRFSTCPIVQVVKVWIPCSLKCLTKAFNLYFCKKHRGWKLSQREGLRRQTISFHLPEFN